MPFTQNICVYLMPHLVVVGHICTAELPAEKGGERGAGVAGIYYLPEVRRGKYW